MNKKYDIYYAHHRFKYDTEVEKYELDLIKRYFPNSVSGCIRCGGYIPEGYGFVCPNCCADLVEQCDELARVAFGMGTSMKRNERKKVPVIIKRYKKKR